MHVAVQHMGPGLKFPHLHVASHNYTVPQGVLSKQLSSVRIHVEQVVHVHVRVHCRFILNQVHVYSPEGTSAFEQLGFTHRPVVSTLKDVCCFSQLLHAALSL